MATEVEALIVDDTRGFFRRGKITRKECNPNEVSIDINFAGICHSDYHNVKAEWAGKAIYPMVPGHEIAGIVDAVGANVTKFKVGDKVGVGCFIDSCRNKNCSGCSSGEEQYCSNSGKSEDNAPGCILTYNTELQDEYAKKKGYPDNVRNTYGGYSQKIVVDENYVLNIPDSVPLEHAAPLLCAGITMYSPLSFFGAKAGGKDFKTAIVGLGGLGDMGVKIAKAMGNSVSVVSRSERKKEYTEKSLGAAFVNSTDEKQMNANKAKFDLMICTISSSFDVGPYLSLVKPSGKFCVVGAPPEDLKLNAFELIHRRITLCGSMIGGIAETQEMLDFCGKHGLWSEVEHIKASEVNRAYCELSSNNAAKQRFVIDVKDTLLPDFDWEVDNSMVKKTAPHKVNPNCTIVGAENTSGKTYYPEKDTFA